MGGIYKIKTFCIGFSLGFVLQIAFLFTGYGMIGGMLVDFLNIGSSMEYIDIYIDVLAYLIIGAILSSIVCVFEKEKVQWIVGSILGAVLSAVLVALFIIFIVIPRGIFDSGPY